MGVLFLSTYNNKIDAKGRVSMPASFRDIIMKTGSDNVIIYKSLTKNCLEGCTNNYIETMQELIEKLDIFSPERDAFETALFAESISLDIDKDGRINIPKQYTHFANIERILNDNPKLDEQKAFSLLSNFNTLNIQYDQLCNDMIKFIQIFKDKEEQEIRLYKTDELVELLEKAINKL